jgi:hypothetical protein
MSPVAPSGSHAGRALLVAAVGVAVVLGGLYLASLVLSGRNSPKVSLGDQTFASQDAERLAAEIARRGPILYSDVSGEKDRDVIVQHLGEDPDEGWYAFLASPDDKARDCTWQWQQDEELFRAKCDESLTAPADGEGLTQFEVTVKDGRVDVDLNADARKRTTTTKPLTGEPLTTTTTSEPAG